MYDHCDWGYAGTYRGLQQAIDLYSERKIKFIKGNNFIGIQFRATSYPEGFKYRYRPEDPFKSIGFGKKFVQPDLESKLVESGIGLPSRVDRTCMPTSTEIGHKDNLQGFVE